MATWSELLPSITVKLKKSLVDCDWAVLKGGTLKAR